jgi:ribosomal-protein-alanine N-acetyltransferase
VLTFERENREWFGRSISDRGEEYFTEFDARHAWLVADQESGGGAYFVAVDTDGAVLGRFNLIFQHPGTAVLGYRVAERAAGQGLATSAVIDVCSLAGRRYGVSEVVAATTHDNIASQRVLTKAGFEVTGPAAPAEIGGKQGSRWRLELTPEVDG